MKVLDLGCGSKKAEGAVGIDQLKLEGVDFVHDLNSYPYPVEHGIWDVIYLDNVLEHLDKPLEVLDEIFSLLKPGGKCIIDVPYFRSHWAFVDPTHQHFFTAKSLMYVDIKHPVSSRYSYTQSRFHIESIVFDRRLTGGILWRAIRYVANKRANAYESILSHLLPLSELTFTLCKPLD